MCEGATSYSRSGIGFAGRVNNLLLWVAGVPVRNKTFHGLFRVGPVYWAGLGLGSLDSRLGEPAPPFNYLRGRT